MLHARVQWRCDCCVCVMVHYELANLTRRPELLVGGIGSGLLPFLLDEEALFFFNVLFFCKGDCCCCCAVVVVLLLPPILYDNSFLLFRDAEGAAPAAPAAAAADCLPYPAPAPAARPYPDPLCAAEALPLRRLFFFCLPFNCCPGLKEPRALFKSFMLICSISFQVSTGLPSLLTNNARGLARLGLMEPPPMSLMLLV